MVGLEFNGLEFNALEIPSLRLSPSDTTDLFQVTLNILNSLSTT